MKLNFSTVKVLVVGDMMLDIYYTGDVSRISPEAPVPVVKISDTTKRLGGACNVANNLSHIGANVRLLGLASDDTHGKILRKMLDDIKVSYQLYNFLENTTSKLRVIGSRQQIARLDFEDDTVLDKPSVDEITKDIKTDLALNDVIIISDYGKGVCTDEICAYIISEAKKISKPVIIDPKGNDWTKYTGATVVTPNVKELGVVANVSINNTDEDVLKYGRMIKDKYDIEYLIVTRSDQGITVIASDYVKTFKAESKEVFDVSGAGDTVVSILAVSFALNYDIAETIELANRAAGIVVAKAHTVPITIEELKESYNLVQHSKMITKDNLGEVLLYYRDRGKKIVFTNGCFDILHIGHVKYLQASKEVGDVLIVGLNSDKSVKMLKGDDRPINNQADRATLLSAFSFIDHVIIFDDETPVELIKTIKPDVLVKGGDYKLEEVVGREYAKKVELIDFVEGYSSTNIINKISN